MGQRLAEIGQSPKWSRHSVGFGVVLLVLVAFGCTKTAARSHLPSGVAVSIDAETNVHTVVDENTGFVKFTAGSLDIVVEEQSVTVDDRRIVEWPASKADIKLTLRGKHLQVLVGEDSVFDANVERP